MSVRKVFAAIKYAEKTFERLSEVVSEEDQDGIAGALMKLTFAKEELEKMIPAPTPAEHQGVQPVAGEGPHWKRQESCSECDGDGCANCEITPKLEEIAAKLADGLTAWRDGKGFEECIGTRDLFTAILRPFITPASTPENYYCPICRAKMYALPATIHCPICEAASPSVPLLDVDGQEFKDLVGRVKSTIKHDLDPDGSLDSQAETIAEFCRKEILARGRE